MKRFENKTVLITGGGSGIGLACATRMATEGANVVIADINEHGATEAVKNIIAQGGKASYIHCDVAQAEDCKKAIDHAICTYKKLDYAINNAGVGGESNLVADYSLEGWQKIMDINLNSVFYCMKYEITAMLQTGGGSIVNMSSILGHVGFASSSGYVSAKHALLGLTKNAAIEYALKNIRVNAICPGFIETPLLTNAGIQDGNELYNYIASLHPMKRMGKAEEVASASLWLLSDEASFVTGTHLLVDGGYTSI